MTTQHDKAKRWRLWQFSLRMLLLLMLVVAVFVALFSPHPFRSGDAIQIRFPRTVDIDENCEIRRFGVLVGKTRNIERLVDGDNVITASLRRGLLVR